MKKIFLGVATVLLISLMTFTNTAAAQKIIVAQNSARWNQRENVKNFPQEVLRLVNAERAKVGAKPLKFADDLAASAFVRATELPTKFSHTRPNGSKCFTAMPQRGHILGENLAGGQTSPQQVVQAWMDSKTHRDNILSKKYTELGVVYYYQPNSKY
ncbi:MAG: hypothetical protein J5497_07805, partial [Selenomonadaceae bacterium]|nr:hypothetical protein [Selenomonadaceae bacterium]